MIKKSMMALVLGTALLANAGARAETAAEACKVSSPASTAMTESEADAQAYAAGRNSCYSYGRQIGKYVDFRPGTSQCTSRPSPNGKLTVWTCVYPHAECCYELSLSKRRHY